MDMPTNAARKKSRTRIRLIRGPGDEDGNRLDTAASSARALLNICVYRRWRLTELLCSR